MKINLRFLRIAALLGLAAVAIGAFAAHGLKAILPIERIAIFKTGVQYHYYHTFALAITSILFAYLPNKMLKYAAWSFIIGIVLFSGSLYLLACRDVLGISSWTFLGPLTPIGGVFFIMGWAMIFVATFTGRSNSI